MAMVQTVVPVYTIPNTYWVQQSLWESICWIIPGIAHTSGSELHSFEPAAPRNTPVEQGIPMPSVGDPTVPEVETAKPDKPHSSAVSSSTRKKDAAQEVHQAGVPFGIPLARSVEVPKEAFQCIPTVNLIDNGDPPGTKPQKTSTPIKTTPAADRSHSGKKLDISKIQGAHLLFEMQDRQEKAWGRESKAEDQAVTSHWVAGGERSSSGELPPGLPPRQPKLPDGDGTPTKLSNLAIGASGQGKKRPLDAKDDVVELLDHDEATGPFRKKKKKNKNKDRLKDKIPSPEAQDKAAPAINATAEAKVVAEKPVPVPATSGTPAEGSKVPKKKRRRVLNSRGSDRSSVKLR